MASGEKVRFYDPHPGFAGAMIPLPGKMMNLSEGLEKIKSVADMYHGSLERVEWAQSIHFVYNAGRFTHGYSKPTK